MSGSLHPRSAGRHRALLPVLCAALGVPGAAGADEVARATQPPEKIEQIVITGTRRPVPISQIGTSLTVIDAETLEQEQKRDAIELLRDVPGVNLARSGSRGGVSSIFVRGGETDHNLILIDGVQVNRGGGMFDLGSLALDGIERVEVLRGPAGALYGSDAIASVVQLVTRRGEGPMQGSVRAAFGSDQTYELGTSLSGGSERFGYSVSAGRYATDGVHGLNNDADNSTFRTRFDFRPTDAWEVKLTTSYADSAFDFPTDFDLDSGKTLPTDPNQGSDRLELSTGLDVGWEVSDRFEHRVMLGLSDSEDVFFDGDDVARGNGGDFGASKSDTDEDRFSGEYRLLWNALAIQEASGFVTLGFEYERERFDQRSRSVAFGTRSASSTSERRRTSAAFLQTDWTFVDDVFVTLGARIDDNTKYGTELTPIVTVAWLLPESSTRLHTALAEGFKEPNFGENFGFPGSAVGNPDLDPEDSTSFEFGVEQAFLSGQVQTSLTFFRTDYDDLISFVSFDDPPPGGPFGTFENVQDVRSQGIEAEVRVALTDRLRVSASYTRLRTRVRSLGSLAESATLQRGENLVRRPTHSGSISLGYTGERFEGRISGALLGPREDIGDSFTRTRNDDRVILDVATSYLVYTSSRGTQTRLTLRAENLLDEDDEEVFGFESPDFQLLAGVELRF